jgi:hypothetical protein
MRLALDVVELMVVVSLVTVRHSDSETSVSGSVDSADESKDENCQCPEEYTLIWVSV